ncbi:MAG: hypothetical protein LBC74_09845, partial [Planctomycetaceae bacterium]|nr:hypothetical protein [Planctomycetaceae bacterium]
KRDHPQSFSYHASWFEGYHALEDYFTRLSYILSQGRQINHVVVIEPTTTAWMYQGTPELGKIGQSFTDFVNALEHTHAEYDLASEDIIKRFGKVDGKEFIINQAKYDLVIIPPNTENLNGATFELLSQYQQNGGELIFVGKLPTLLDGVPFQMPMIFQKEVTVDEAVNAAKERTAEDGLIIETDNKHIFHHRRRLADGEVLFLCNSSLTDKFYVEVKKNENYLFNLFNYCNAQNGAISSYLYPGKTETKIPLAPSESLLLVCSNDALIKQQHTLNPSFEKITTMPIPETKIRRLEDNVLTLDYVDVKVGGGERKDIYTWAANRFVFQKHGMGGNPWDSQVQFKDKLITKKFPDNSGFEATYHFTLQESIPKNLAIVIERSELYKIYCNDKEVKAIPNTWWLDRSFGKIDLSNVAKVGENNVKIVAQPMTIEHELEPAYLLGDFSLQKSDKGFIVVPPQPLSWEASEQTNVLKHSEEVEQVSWLSAGVGFRADKPELNDREPTLEFDFGQEQKIDAIRIWNYNERNLKQRGVKTVEITGLGKIDLPIGDGSAYELSFDSPQTFKTISFKILSNHNGVTYPIKENEQPKDNGFVGLAEVQFLTKKGDKLIPIKNVTVKASSELAIDSHDRKAKYLVNGNGLIQAEVQGWNRRGMPFYAGKVEYSQTFNVDNIDSSTKKYFVKLPSSPKGWYGSTAQIVVNGKSAGFVISATWQVDVTKLLSNGKNEISVIVFGTPKNLLGPHHAGAMRGSAWPGSFHRAPEHQPSGASYDTIDYGLFEPFQLFYVE